MARPTTYPDFATNATGSDISTPDSAHQIDGFQNGFVPRQWLNFLFQWIGKWIRHLDETVQTILGDITTLQGETANADRILLTGVFNLRFTGIGSSLTVSHCWYTRHKPYAITGNPVQIDIKIEGIYGTASNSELRFQTAEGELPASICPSAIRRIPIDVRNIANIYPGILEIHPNGQVIVYTLEGGGFSANFSNTGTKGFTTDLFFSYII